MLNMVTDEYQEPEVWVLSVEVEKGFEGSVETVAPPFETQEWN